MAGETWEEVAERNRPVYEAALRQAEQDLAELEEKRRALMVTIAGFRALLDGTPEPAAEP